MRRNMRASVDAAADAILLVTRQASEASVDVRLTMRAEAFDTAACESTDSQQPAASQPTGFAMPAVSTSTPSSPSRGQGHSWSFEDNLQRARMRARYAALDAADEIQYECPDDTDSSDDGEDGGWAAGSTRGGRSAPSTGVLAPKAKPRKSWSLLQLFGGRGASSSSGGKGRAAAAAGGRGDGRGKSRLVRGQLDSDEEDLLDDCVEEDVPMPVHMRRDSRVVYRARLGLDGRPEQLRALLGSYDIDPSLTQDDDVDAAVAAAAAAFATAVSAVSVTGPNGVAPCVASAPLPLLDRAPTMRRVHFRRPPVVAVHRVAKCSDEISDASDKSGTQFTFLGRLRSQLLSLSGSSGKSQQHNQQPPQQLPNSAQLYRVKAAPSTAHPPPVHSHSAPLLRIGAPAAPGGAASAGAKASPTSGGSNGRLFGSFRNKGVIPVSGEL
ncbi:hypothetical protein GPECTOR_52g21 [Gonium pectorale]|uniref:Uncharacterized protein n=1 Tax=Gonium pectorale TaxID=33097 RepID=A0A150G6X8_GONPE|nr:hypothetical protein GPECTOR_52g21 [Gonium pectorale]|eukprot:KXZ45619.1 hypothetical protein GPECTOR_52g21 [Gonium pectorale]